MQPRATHPPPLRAVIIDDHPISRSAVGALLRSEGVDVIAEFASSEATAETIRALRPDLVIVDARPGLDDGPDAARRAASFGGAVVLTSSARASAFGAALDGFAFIAKADICRSALTNLLTAKEHSC